MSRLFQSFALQLAVVAVLALSIGAGFAAWQAQRTQSKGPGVALAASQNTGAGGAATGGAAAGGQRQRSGAPNGQPPIVGTIDAIKGNQLTIKEDSGSATVAVNDATVIRKTEDAGRAGLKAGANVVVIGTAGANGATDATLVQVLDGENAGTFAAQGFGNLGGQAQGGQPSDRQNFRGQNQGGQNGTDGASGRATVFGTIDKVTDTGFTVNTTNGPATVTVGDRTQIRHQVEAKLADLKAGDPITVVADSGAGGTMTASMIQIGDTGFGGFSRRGQ